MPRTNSFDLFDRILGGRLVEILGELRAEGLSIVEITFRLRSMDVEVSTDTVARWLRREDVEAFLAKQEPAA